MANLYDSFQKIDKKILIDKFTFFINLGSFTNLFSFREKYRQIYVNTHYWRQDLSLENQSDGSCQLKNRVWTYVTTPAVHKSILHNSLVDRFREFMHIEFTYIIFSVQSYPVSVFVIHLYLLLYRLSAFWNGGFHLKFPEKI